jgi:hypothetical protein
MSLLTNNTTISMTSNTNNSATPNETTTGYKLKHLNESFPKLVLTSTNSSSSFNSNGAEHAANSNERGEQADKKNRDNDNNQIDTISPTLLTPPAISSMNGKKTIDFSSNQQSSNGKPSKPVRSISNDNDDAFIEGILNAKDRRSSWQQIRAQRSYIPSLSAICKF